MNYGTAMVCVCCVDGKLGQDNAVDPDAAVFVSEDLFFFPRKSDSDGYRIR